MTSAETVTLAAGVAQVVSFGPFSDGDYCTSLTPVIATPNGIFTLDVRAFRTQAECAGFEGGQSITRRPVTFPAGLAGIDGSLPVGHRFREGFSWLAIKVAADGGSTGIALSVWPTISRAARS